MLVFLHSSRPGLIPPELGLLVTLQQLELQGNALTGIIPRELGGLVNLQYLGLHDNQLLGTFFFLDDIHQNKNKTTYPVRDVTTCVVCVLT